MFLRFNATGDFAAVKEAEEWCERHGLAVGPVDQESPRGILFGSHAIPKWHNLRQADKDALHGTMTGNMREGPVTVAVDAHAVRRAGGLLIDEQQRRDEMCACGDRAAVLCPGQWEPGCDLGANEKYVKAGVSDADRLKASAPGGLPKVPDEVMQYLQAYGDSRADDDGLSADRLGAAVLALRAWAGELQAQARDRHAVIARRHSTCRNDTADVIACAIESEASWRSEAHDGSANVQPQPEDQRLRIKVKRELFSFRSQQEWVNKAKSWYANCGVRQGHYITVDANGHVMHMGKCFMEATRQNAYPVTVYELQTNWAE